MADPIFTVNGTVRGLGQVTITWTPDGGFDDPSGRTTDLIGAGEEVCSTVTGPCYKAAVKPGVVAYLTALAALDQVTSAECTPALQAQLDELALVPTDASA